MERALASRGHSVDVVDPVVEKLLVLTRPHFAYPAGESPHEALASRLAAAQAYVMVTPEYNHAPGPALLNLLDHFGSSTFAFKPSLIVSYSQVEAAAMPVCVITALALAARQGEEGEENGAKRPRVAPKGGRAARHFLASHPRCLVLMRARSARLRGGCGAWCEIPSLPASSLTLISQSGADEQQPHPHPLNLEQFGRFFQRSLRPRALSSVPLSPTVLPAPNVSSPPSHPFLQGQWGGVRAAAGLRPILCELGCLPVSAMVHVPAAQAVLSPDGQCAAGADEARWEAYAVRGIAQMEW
jgi:NAD(P)H-dependent FMN reductase